MPAMFVQLLRARVRDRDGLRRQWDAWHREVAPGASGWLGSTAGITADGGFAAAARFESEAAALANQDRPEQRAWWTATERLLEGARFRVDVGPRSNDALRSLRSRAVPSLRAGAGTAHVDYPAAQAYAAALLALHAVQQVGRVDEGATAELARGLRSTTFFGRYGLAADGLQVDHEALVVQWQDGVKRVVWPHALAEAPVAG